MKKITYVAGNEYKIELAQRILNPLGIEILQKKIKCPEIQDDDIEDVSKYEEKALAQFEYEKRWKFWPNEAYLGLQNYLEKR